MQVAGGQIDGLTGLQAQPVQQQGCRHTGIAGVALAQLERRPGFGATDLLPEWTYWIASWARAVPGCRCALRGRILPPPAPRSGAPAGTAAHRRTAPSSRRALCRRSDHGRWRPAVRPGRRAGCPAAAVRPRRSPACGIARVCAPAAAQLRDALWDLGRPVNSAKRGPRTMRRSTPLRGAGALAKPRTSRRYTARHLQPHGQHRELLLRASTRPVSAEWLDRLRSGTSSAPITSRSSRPVSRAPSTGRSVSAVSTKVRTRCGSALVIWRGGRGVRSRRSARSCLPGGSSHGGRNRRAPY